MKDRDTEFEEIRRRVVASAAGEAFHVVRHT
ncbi:hypothetical protein ACUXIW_000547 [Ralstonia pickettii]|uniref:Uncharacterized protein n=1 Tax=Ralstonia pickettii TaxID=329 RepID=A0ABM9IHL8_RALPI|nr:hypothetical protein R38712_00337 [Ralstonia pickettii]